MGSRGAAWRWALLILGSLVGLDAGVRASGQEGATPPHWIWYPSGKSLGEIPAETCYFRKAFFANENSRLVLDATADNAFTLYLDGKEITRGSDWHTGEHVDLKLSVGPHILAAAASNEAPGPAGFLLRGGVLPLGQGAAIHSNSTWKTARNVGPRDAWTELGFDDSSWVRARDHGRLGSRPWLDVSLGQDAAARFHVPEGFRIDMIASPEITGSVVAFTFDPEGVPCVSIEGGPIARLTDDDKDGRYDRREAIETQVRNCQGLAFIRDRLFVVGHGPAGAGIYCLSDFGPKGTYQKCALIQQSAGGMGEHGPHAIALGPDGRLYFGTGNHAHLKPPIDPESPVNRRYEGELLPHYNDPRGHAAGIMAPGGEILRSDDEGRTWKRVAAGFRNQYDFAFNREGELFTFDSDMEWDVSLPWYRPVRVNHCPVGAEFGWCNGSGKWPTYYFDSLPAILDVGRGSPTGVTFYQAHQFPPQYDDSMLLCDWSLGRILAVRMEHRGASYAATASNLVTGQPLNCTDIEVGPDGAVYFTTGGRGTQGGLFRVSWSQARPDPLVAKPTAADALRFSSPLASFTRSRVEAIRRADPEAWAEVLKRVAKNSAGGHSDRDRIRALDLLCQHGPQPEDELLIALASDADRAVRRRATALLGQRVSQPVREALARALADSDPFVRRRACEGFMQQPRETIPTAALLPLLVDPDRGIRFAARIAIVHGDRQQLLSALGTVHKPQPRMEVEGMIAYMLSSTLQERRQDFLLRREARLLERRLEPDVQTDLLRLIELTYLLGDKKADASASEELRPILLGLFSISTDSPANREIARLLAFLDEPRAVDAILRHQAAVTDQTAQLHDAYCLRALKRGWSAAAKRQFWAWYQTASGQEGGYSFQGYLDVMLQRLVALLSPEEIAEYLAHGERFPFPTRVLVRQLDLGADPHRVSALADLYRRVSPGQRSSIEADLRAVIIEKLRRSHSAEARAALRDLVPNNFGQSKVIARPIAGQKEHTLPVLVDRVLNADVMKTASSPRGKEVIERAKCLDCHKFGSKGEGVGPDLTAISSRFRPVEILESIVEPSKVISDQYKSVTVATSDGKIYNGMPVVSDGPNLVLLLADGTKATIPKTEIEAQRESKVSVMPLGLIDALSYQEIADLLALFSSAARIGGLGGGK
jgi:putative heme-binding domain-containing protein